MSQLLEHSATSIAQQAHYEALAAQRSALTTEADALRLERAAVEAQFNALPTKDPARGVLDQRMIELDERIQAVKRLLGRTTNDLVELGPMPGMLVPPPEIIQVDRENLLMGGFFALVLLLPISIAFARRIWRRSTTAVAALPSDLMERLNRMEAAVDSTAIEVERIGEGQRFLTRLMSDHMTAIKETSRAGFLERAKERASHSGTTPH